MSSTATTQYYGLTQYIGTDKPDFADNNSAFRNVDADLHQVVQDSQGFTSDIADLTVRVGNLRTDLTNLSGDLDGEKAKITALQNKELSQDTEISRVERNAQDMITAYNEASATSTHAYAVGDYFIYNNVLYQATAAIAVGATIVPDTNCTTTNVTSELIQLNNDLSTKQTKITRSSRINQISAKTTFSTTEIILQIPANHVALIRVNAIYANHAPSRVGLVINNNPYAVGVYDSVTQLCAVNTMLYSENGLDVTIYAQYEAVGNEDVSYDLTLIPLD